MTASKAKKAGDEGRAPKRKGGHRLTENDWDKIVVLALRGNRPPAIARMTGFHERTIRRFWAVGFPSEPWGATPIKAILEHEEAKARALRERIGEKRAEPRPMEVEERVRVEQQLGAATLPEREAAKKDALDARVAEAQLVKLARGNVLALLAGSASLAGSLARLSSAVARSISDPKYLANVDPASAIDLLRKAAGFTKDVVEIGSRAMEMERLILGDPRGSGKLSSDADQMSLEEATTELLNAAKISDAVMRRAALKSVAGGAGKASTSTGLSTSGTARVDEAADGGGLDEPEDGEESSTPSPEAEPAQDEPTDASPSPVDQPSGKASPCPVCGDARTVRLGSSLGIPNGPTTECPGCVGVILDDYPEAYQAELRAMCEAGAVPLRVATPLEAAPPERPDDFDPTLIMVRDADDEDGGDE